MDFTGDAPRTITVPGTVAPGTVVREIFIMEGITTITMTPARVPEGVMAVFVDSFYTILREHSTAPRSFRELPDVGRPAENMTSKADGTAGVMATVKGVVFSIFRASLGNFVAVSHSFLIIGDFVVKN